jgi:hypothetical protein
MIRANDQGVSLYTEQGVRAAELSGWAWKISSTRIESLVPELKLLCIDFPTGYYRIVPRKDMPMNQYAGLLEVIGSQAAERAFHLPKIAKAKV